MGAETRRCNCGQPLRSAEDVSAFLLQRGRDGFRVFRDGTVPEPDLQALERFYMEVGGNALAWLHHMARVAFELRGLCFWCAGKEASNVAAEYPHPGARHG